MNATATLTTSFSNNNDDNKCQGLSLLNDPGKGAMETRFIDLGNIKVLLTVARAPSC
jgi:hypothetical protein